jgi:small multidrug resistance pump
MHWLYLAIAIMAEVVATSFLKTASGFTRIGPTLGVLAGYGIAFFFLSLTLKDIPVGVGYAIWSGVGVTLIALIGWLGFGEKLDPPAIVGMTLIVAGVVVLNLFSKTAAH